MSTSIQKNGKFDIKKRKQYAFDASVENSKGANEAIKVSQNWLLVLALAELSFIGSLLLTDTLSVSVGLLKLLALALLASFISFIVASIAQYQHVLRIARVYECISMRAVQNYLQKGIDSTDEEPKELELPQTQIASNKIANRLFLTSYVLVILATLGIAIVILKL